MTNLVNKLSCRMRPIVIRELLKSEIPQLDGFLYDAVFIPEGEERPGRDIIQLPELSAYISDPVLWWSGLIKARPPC